MKRFLKSISSLLSVLIVASSMSSVALGAEVNETVADSDNCHHAYTSACDVTCDICGAERVAPHVYSEEYALECSVCGAARGQIDEVLEASGTSFYFGHFEDRNETFLFMDKAPTEYINADDHSVIKNKYVDTIIVDNSNGGFLYADTYNLKKVLNSINFFWNRSKVVFRGELIGYSLSDIIYNVSEVVVGKGATIIPDGYFRSSNMESIIISEGVTEIGSYAFGECKYLRFVKLPKSLTTIGSDAFEHCTSLKGISLPDSITRIENSIFIGCDQLQWVVLPKNLEYISNNEFGGCRALQCVVVKSDTLRVEGFSYGYLYYPCSNPAIDISTSNNVCVWHDIDTNTGYCNGCGEYFDKYECRPGLPHLFLGLGLDNNSEDYLFFDTRCEYICAMCGHFHKYSNNCDTTCNYCGEVRTDIRQHEYISDCCTYCWACLEERTPLAEHEYSSLCDAKCNVCGEERTPLADHEYSYGCDRECDNCGATHYYYYEYHEYTNDCDDTCDNCGATRKAPHYGDSNTCKAYCTECGVDISTLPHIFTDECDSTCDRCGEERVAPHVTNALYPNKCIVCGAIAEKDHLYSDACDATCDLCGFERIPPHVFDNEYDAICNLCGYEREALTPPVTSPTPTVDPAGQGAGGQPVTPTATPVPLDPTSTPTPEGICKYCRQEAAISSKSVKYDNNTTFCEHDTDGDGKYDLLIISGKGDLVKCWTSTALSSDELKNIKTVRILQGVTSIGTGYFSDFDGLISLYIPDSVGKVDTWSGLDKCNNLKNISMPCNLPQPSELKWKAWSVDIIFRHSFDRCNDECKECGKIIEGAGHLYDDCNDSVCNKCGLKRETPSHIYNDVCDTTCNVCGETREAIHEFSSWFVRTEATCSAPGEEYRFCPKCFYNDTRVTEINPSNHEAIEIDEAVAATCTSTGLTEGSHCSVCGKIISNQEVIEKNGHTAIVNPGYAATCVSTGLTDGEYCAVCDEVLKEQLVIGMIPHNIVVDPEVPATETSTGLTSGTHCSVCNKVFVKQVVIPMITPEPTSTTPTAIATPVPTSAISGDCGDSVYYEITDEDGDGKPETLIIRGEGDMYYSPIGDVPWSDYRDDITTVIIEDGVTSIYDFAFSDCCNLISVEISDSVEFIGNNAFEGCSQLSSIEIPDSVDYIGDYAFSGCEGLTEINIPESVTCIGCFAFAECLGLTSFVIPDSVIELGYDLLSGSTNITSVTIPVVAFPLQDFGCESVTSVLVANSVTEITNSAFAGCYDLESVSIPNSVTRIGSHAFEGCDKLLSIELPDSVEYIGDYAFAGCYDLESVSIPNSVTRIGSNAFEGCYKLLSIELPDSVEYIGDCAFIGCEGLTNISIPDSVVSFGEEIFIWCNRLESICVSCSSAKYLSDYSDVLKLRHEYDNDNDVVCNVCGAIKESHINHTCKNWEVIKEATCSSLGEMTGICVECGSEVTKPIDMDENNHESIVIDPYVPATENSLGYTEGSHCSACEKTIVEQQEIPALTPEPTPTSTPTVAPTATPVPTATSTPVPTATPTMEPTATATPVPTVTVTTVPTKVPTVEPTVIPTAEPTEVPAIPTAVPTVVPTATSTPVSTSTPTPEPTVTATVTPNTTVVPTVNPTVTSTPKPTVTPKPTATATPVPTKVPTATSTPAPTATSTPKPTVAPTATATPKPTEVPTVVPTATSTPVPTSTPTLEPTATATPVPTKVPTAEPTVVPTIEPTVEPEKADVSSFAERLYTTCLGRDSEEDGKSYWASELKTGKTGAEVAEGFFFSPEFVNKNLSDEEYIGSLYETFMGRTPADEEVAYWASEMKNGQDRRSVFDGFVNSPEWADICLDYGIRSGGLAKPTHEKAASEEVQSFAERLYTTCLGRDSETEGLKYWSQELANLRTSGTEAARGFFFSPEFINLKLSNEDYVTRLYRTFMGREPEKAGYDYWVGQLYAGASREEVFDGFAGAPEFGEICAEAGIFR